MTKFNIGQQVWSYRSDRRNLKVKGIWSDSRVELVGESYHCNEKGYSDGWHSYEGIEHTFLLRDTPFQEDKTIHSPNKWDKIIDRTTLNSPVKYMYMDYLEGKLNLSPNYQRDLVWTLKQKQAYILAIFKEKASITPTLILDWEGAEDIHEVLDGKQRLTAIFDFIEDKFELENGMKYSDLSRHDANWFMNSDVKYTRITKWSHKNLTLDEKIEIFLEINELGTKMNDEHIEKVKNMLGGVEE